MNIESVKQVGVEVIQSIESECMFKDSNDWSDTEGVKITTNRQVIQLSIDTRQSCCEQVGYFLSEDEPSEFVGAVLMGINRVDEALKVTELPVPVNDTDWLYNGGCVFINVETDKGTLQFAAYNAHNGYYGHAVVIKSNQLQVSECI